MVTADNSREAALPERAAGAPGEPVGVSLIDVAKRFDAQPEGVFAVRDLSIHIEPGEFVTLLGPSGCGKSTTLHLIAGLEMPSDGQIFIGDRDVTFLEPQQRDAALVFQSYALYPHLDVYDNIGFPLRLKKRGLSENAISERVTQAARVLGLGDLLERKPSELSGGQRQRTALARAIVRQPSVFLFDEPLSNLDNLLRVQTRAELKELHEQLGATMIYVTHDQAEAMVMSDRVVVMNEGRIQQIGPPLEVYRRPVNTFVATFVGEHGTNLLPGGVVRTDSRGPVFQQGDVVIGLPGLPAEARPSYTLGIRPENLTVVDSEHGDLRGLVRVVEPYGDRTRVRASVGIYEIVASAPPAFSATPGEDVWLVIGDHEALSLFDDVSGDALMMS